MNWDEIKAKCPKLYQKRFTFECGLGWADIIHDLSVKIEKILEENPDCIEMFAVQVKEKYGSLRYYMEQETDEIIDMISDAEALSTQTCENCGAPAKMRGKRWIITRCDKCYGAQK
jgi:hypothetical protein